MCALGTGMSALVVDDEDALRSNLCELLTELEFEVETGSSLAETRELLANRTFDLIVLDKSLPDGSGLDIARNIGTLDSAVIIVSGWADVDSAIEAIQLGVADYIIKPFGLEDVEARLGRAISALRERRKNAALVRDLEEKTATLERLVATDLLTDLHNFAYVRERIREEAARCRRTGDPFSIVQLDVASFRSINEQHGHGSGDSFLQQVGKALRGELEGVSTLRGQDIAARIGGDVFLIVMPSTSGQGAASRARSLVLELCSAIDRPDGKPLQIDVGIATFPDHADDEVALLAAVGLALDAAKSSNANLVTFFDGLALQKRQEQLAASRLANQQQALDGFIAESSFLMHYQPIVDHRGAIYAYEALLRPLGDDFAHVGEVFQAAERAGRVLDLERAIRKLAVEPLGLLEEQQKVFINLHPLALYDTSLLSGQELWLSDSHSRVVFEITEVAEITDFDRARENIAVLRQLGFEIAVDDLGAGYSGLNNLATLAPDFVKLDMAMVRGLDSKPRLGRLIRHIIDYADHENMNVIAEGVETREEYEAVRELGVHLVQGYYFARPAPPFVALSNSP